MFLLCKYVYTPAWNSHYRRLRNHPICTASTTNCCCFIVCGIISHKKAWMCNLPFHSPKKICNEHHNYDFTCIFQVPKKSFLKVKIHCRVFCSGLILWLKTINFFVGFRSYMTAHCCRIISSCPKIGTNRVFTMHTILHQ